MRRFGCSGAMRPSTARDDFVSGLYVGEGDARGELTFELTRRMRSDIEPLRGTTWGVDGFGLA